jgi:flagella basal body P-ring formation protein FlgA
MKALIATLTTAAVLVLAAPQGARGADDGRTAPAPTVARDHVIVDGDVILLGDLFVNAGEYADKAVAYAPQPGQRAVFDLNWLYRVAKAYKLNWRPAHRGIKVTVQRDAQMIGRAEIADHILAALVDKGAAPDSLIDISNRSLKLYVPTDTAAMVAVEDITYDRRTRRFTAIVAAPAGDPTAKRVRVTGQAHRMVEVPVPARRILAGEVIADGDIKYVPMRADRVQNNVVVAAEDVIGKTARRGSLREGQPIRANMIRRPLLVKKGNLVTMIIHVPNMTLTAKGKALEDGSDGDTIRVSNTQSNTVVETVVIGSQRVSVVPIGEQFAMANN